MSDRTGRPDGLQAWTELSATVDAVRVAINRDLQAEAGLTLADNLVLCRVAMAPGRRLRMVEIASGLNIAKSAVTKTVDRLEQRGLLDRDRDRDDRRTVYASLTSEGQKVFEAAQPSFVASVDRHFTRHLDPAHIRALHQLQAAVLADPRIGRGGTASAGHDDRRVADPRTRSAHLPGPDRLSRPAPPDRAHPR